VRVAVGLLSFDETRPPQIAEWPVRAGHDPFTLLGSDTPQNIALRRSLPNYGLEVPLLSPARPQTPSGLACLPFPFGWAPPTTTFWSSAVSALSADPRDCQGDDGN